MKAACSNKTVFLKIVSEVLKVGTKARYCQFQLTITKIFIPLLCYPMRQRSKPRLPDRHIHQLL